ncbi:hypothetical protein BGX26_001104 [Mortierella sp. AD094]|nr:hypothetical protein BGX26_001104 [Mortierella sp. AD094]
MEKIVYKSHNIPGHHKPDVFVLAEPGMAAKYRSCKESIPLVDVVQSFDVFQSVTGRGFEGDPVRPAKADLDAIFNTENSQEIVEHIVLQGEIQ